MTNNIEALRGLRGKLLSIYASAEEVEQARQAIDAALAAMGGQGEGVCHWRQQDESGDWFSTGCGHEFVLNDARQYADGDAPFPFCAYCAKPMRFYRWRDESPCTCDNGDGPECEGCTDNRRCSAISAPQQPEAQGELTEQQKADRDAVMYGTGFMLGGKHIPAQDVMVVQAPQQPEAQAGAPGTPQWMAEVLRGAASQIEILGKVSYVEHLRQVAAYIEARALQAQPAEAQAGGRLPCPYGDACVGRDCNRCGNFTPATSAQPKAQAVPVAVVWGVLEIGARGSAYDLPDTRRAFTYEHQPGNIVASRLGSAVCAAEKMRAGDSIDKGLGLLLALQDAGFGVFQIGPAITTPPAKVPEGLTARDRCVLRFALHRFMGEAYARHNEASQKTTAGLYASGAAERFYRDAKDAERLLSVFAAAPAPKEGV